MKNMPFPSNDSSYRPNLVPAGDTPPWKRSKATDPPLMMFQIAFCDGRRISYAYSDLRETRVLHAGHVTLCLYAMEKTHVVIEGRNLTELADLIESGKLRSMQELGPRTFDRPEDGPSIDRITVEQLTGPGA